MSKISGRAKKEQLKFKAQSIKLQDLPNNHDWALATMPMTRIAAVLCSKDWIEVEAFVRGMMQPHQPRIFEMLDDFARSREALSGMVELIELGEARVLATLQRIAPGLDRQAALEKDA